MRVLPLEGPEGPDTTLSIADRDQLDRGFQRLPMDQRAIFILHHYLGWTHAEIAENLGIPIGTAKSRIYYATQTLRAALEADARTVTSAERSALAAPAISTDRFRPGSIAARPCCQMSCSMPPAQRST